MKKIKDFMTRNTFTIGEDQTLAHAKQLMYTHEVRHLPVLKGGQLVGVLSDRDIKLAYAIEGEKAKDIRVGDSCTSDTYTANVEENLKNVAAIMADKLIGCCIITDKNNVVGIFTVTDACRVLSQLA